MSFDLSVILTDIDISIPISHIYMCVIYCFATEKHFVVQVCRSLCTHSSIDGYLIALPKLRMTHTSTVLPIFSIPFCYCLKTEGQTTKLISLSVRSWLVVLKHWDCIVVIKMTQFQNSTTGRIVVLCIQKYFIEKPQLFGD